MLSIGDHFIKRVVPEADWKVIPGQKYGCHTVISPPFYDKPTNKHQKAECKCDCGKVNIRAHGSILACNSSCGNTCGFRMVGNILDIEVPEDKYILPIGFKIHKLEVISKPEYRRRFHGDKKPTNREQYLLCRCECGVEKWINGYSLKRGIIYACGCSLSKAKANGGWYARKAFNGEKSCRRCEKRLPTAEFAKSSQTLDGFSHYCSICSKKSTLKKYGVTVEEFIEQVEKQDYKCAICHTEYPITRSKEHTICLVIDHCHTLNKVRGYICSHCNTVLGCAKDDPEILRNAALYIENFQASLSQTEELEVVV